MTRTIRKAPWMLGPLALSLSLCLRAGAAEPAAFEDLLAEGRRLLEGKDCSGAIKTFRKAEKLAAPSFELLSDTSRAYACFGGWKDAENYARRAIDAAVEPPQKAEAWNRLGQTLFRSGAANEAGYKAASEAFRQAITISDGKLAIARFNLGMALLKLAQDEEGVALLTEFLAEFPNAPGAEPARSFIANPLRARVPMLPDFEITTLAGQKLSSQELQGKVVLLDFWATWCKPCRDSAPELKRLAKRLAAEPFLVLSISSERDEKLVRRFIAEEEMSWPQFVDTRQFFDDQLNVKSLPTFVLVDHKGVIIHRASGWGPGVQGDLSGRISKAIKEAKKARPTS